MKKVLGAVWILSLLPIVINADEDSHRQEKRPFISKISKKRCKKKHRPKEREVYGFVVIGAGNSGCVVANRLSENGKYSVCLLEYRRDDARATPAGTELLPLP